MHQREKEYKVREVFYSLAGEGLHAGRPTIFVRFSGCNLWSGREEDREQAKCTFCDTQFRDTTGPMGGHHHIASLLKVALDLWPQSCAERPYVVFTGGEPSLQLDEVLVQSFKDAGFETAIETNGTRAIPQNLDWVCVSPKGLEPLVVTAGDELKLVVPQDGVDPATYLEHNFAHYFLQPLWDSDRKHWGETARYCLENPPWRLSLQTHKILGLP